MKLPEHERAAHRAAFAQMSWGERAEYIFAYYKLELVIALIIIVALGSGIKYAITHKDAVLYVAYTNVSVSEEMDGRLGAGYLAARGIDERRNEVYLYRGLYLSENPSSSDHQYAYASRLKVLAAVDAQQLDIVLMNQESYDLLSAGGYLLDLDALAQSDPAFAEVAAGLLVENTVVLEDNALEVELGEADVYEAVTEDVVNAIDVTDAFGGRDALTGNIYLGIIGNSPRTDEALAYIAYLLS